METYEGQRGGVIPPPKKWWEEPIAALAVEEQSPNNVTEVDSAGPDFEVGNKGGGG